MHRKPSPTLQLQLLDLLSSRRRLSLHEQKDFEKLTKGFDGEHQFHTILQDNLSSHCITLYDLLLKSYETEFQLDTLLISTNTIYLFEVKNYHGDFYFENDKWYFKSSKKEIRNPLLQLKRSESLLRELLHHTSFNFSIQPYLIFINPTFTLYQAPIHLPAIFPTQILTFIRKLNQQITSQTNKQKSLAHFFIDQHIPQSSFEKLPTYTYSTLKKGIRCKQCHAFLSTYHYQNIVCNQCHTMEKLDLAIMRNITEFTKLFPNEKITTNIIHDWCAIIKSKKTIRRILKQNFTKIGTRNHTHYVRKK